MALVFLIAAVLTGSAAADKLNHPHPLAIGWFEAAVTLALIVGAIVLYALGRGDDEP